MLTEPLRRYYERCVPAEVMSSGGWDVVEPRVYTEVLHDAYQRRAYGTIAFPHGPVSFRDRDRQGDLAGGDEAIPRQRKARSCGPLTHEVS